MVTGCALLKESWNVHREPQQYVLDDSLYVRPLNPARQTFGCIHRIILIYLLVALLY